MAGFIAALFSAFELAERPYPVRSDSTVRLTQIELLIEAVFALFFAELGKRLMSLGTAVRAVLNDAVFLTLFHSRRGNKLALNSAVPLFPLDALSAFLCG